jgi:hypothetical protein
MFYFSLAAVSEQPVLNRAKSLNGLQIPWLGVVSRHLV